MHLHTEEERYGRKKERNTGRLRRILVDAICNPHWHGRELAETTGDLILLAYLGGADILGPMPNTKIPLLTARDTTVYVEGCRRLALRRKLRMRFIPIVMLNEDTTYGELTKCKKAGIVDGKIYPYLRTTRSAHGVKHWGKMIQVVKWCGELGIKVHVHFEHPDLGYIDRECEYLCLPVCQIFLEETDAIIVWEHGSDSRCIPMWKKFAKTGRFFLTITAHHLAWNEDDASGDVRKRCRPLIKPEPDRNALVYLVCEDCDWVMLGADDAAHPVDAKHIHDGKCACGDFTSPFLHLLCAHALDCLLQTKRGITIYNNFTSRNGRRFHKLGKASRQIGIIRRPSRIQPSYKVGPWIVESAGAKEELLYSFTS
ncbi:MAG: hypothetical protein A2849_02270 [Candidatus Taylorbacteria bacterium RIFCSPHIGHO2_01_FULL_51_15]|uniref:Uncharacterized protein n=1 Tax=Candidatus Taylorbacteria bacterium RIFCSPHIGHO2_01_FULL_51_15 TaxID=1802304 RepID=A0A1G2MDE4_9BACT|nr:MAG: hypothetical protein A2849_02270 [Candidatus Taylorbacteria bacterium RIFCSPHIGHO2_01_FULL_51_15]